MKEFRKLVHKLVKENKITKEEATLLISAAQEWALSEYRKGAYNGFER